MILLTCYISRCVLESPLASHILGSFLGVNPLVFNDMGSQWYLKNYFRIEFHVHFALLCVIFLFRKIVSWQPIALDSLPLQNLKRSTNNTIW